MIVDILIDTLNSANSRVKSKAHNIGVNMNINKIVKDSVNGIKDKYNNTQLNPFKMPENINVTITIDYEQSVSNLFKALGKIKQEDMDNIAKLGKLVESSMKKAIK